MIRRMELLCYEKRVGVGQPEGKALEKPYSSLPVLKGGL